MTRETHKDALPIDNLANSEAEAVAWQFLLAARDVFSQPDAPGYCLSYDETSRTVVQTDSIEPATWLWTDDQGKWCSKTGLPAICQAAFDLYLPALGVPAGNDCIVAHLGQSIDAQIATSSGDAFYVTGEENRRHLHCLRALCNAVIVGAGTVVADDPQLTTRAVPGTNPVRVIVDPHARLRAPLKILDDGQARTILVHQSSADLTGLAMHFGPEIEDHTGRVCCQVERLVVPDSDDAIAVRSLVKILRSIELRRLFVEGGGITVSRFFEERMLDRLHVAVAPVLVGKGTPALQLRGVARMMQAHRPPYAIYRMGEDVLWDFDVCGMKAHQSHTGDWQNISEIKPSMSFPGPPFERLV